MILQALSQIKLLFLDVDGVLTDGSVLVTEEGQQLRKFSIKDGYALQLAVKAGLRIVVISGGRSQGVLLRLQGLGISDIYLGVSDKLTLMKEIIEGSGVVSPEIAFMGDDIPDLLCMQYVGVALCPNDAVEEIKAISGYVSPRNGGDGCVRDVIEKILKLRGLWNADVTVKSV
ncbi:KdsC family phosphatase [Sphingobacterium suaedae]|uniref:KdsC family phosphatase n=1 Tax=Sphingobacterium suaedae TaxID=1686402 RepID=A0ABW5KGN4_9SPHI